ncbi:MAG: acyl-CoA dehydratase activase-related protein, partial [Candidatus Aminicenantaceae bacterium]
IGIPRLFSQYYEFFPLWKGFFEALDCDVVTSGKTNPKIVRKCLDNVVAETCFPAELTYGHIKDLLEQGVDFIFFPSLIDAPRTQWKERKTYFCTLSQNMPFAAAATSSQISAAEHKLLRPALRLHEKFFNLEEEMIRVAQKLGRKKKQAQTALQAGWQAWKTFKLRIKERGQEIFPQIEKWGAPVVIAARPYTIGDPGINVDLPNMILKAGGFPVPLDYLPLEEVNIRSLQDSANWNFYHRLMRAARIIRSRPHLHSIFFSVFSCGPDSFLEEFYKEALSGKPFLGIEVGKTTAPAHIQTRVEAFMDCIKDRSPKMYPATPLSFTIHTPAQRRTLYAPHMDEDVAVFEEAMKILDIEVRPLPVSTPQSLSLANRYIPEKTCLPARMTAGDYLHFLLHNSHDPKKIAFFNHQADGACRQKVYHLLQHLVFQRLGYTSIPIITPTPGKSSGYIRQMELINGGKKITRRQAARFFLRFWKSVTANEAARQMVLSRRPYEKKKGSLDETYRQGLPPFLGSIVQGNIQKAAFDFMEKIKQVPLHQNQEKINIGIVGEGYVRLHQPSNQDCIRRLEELGAVAVLPMAASFLSFSLEYVCSQSRPLFLRGIKYVKEFSEKSIMNRVHPYLVFPEPHSKTIIEKAARFLDPRAVSEAVEGIGLASLYAGSPKISGILNLIPAHCMAGSSLQCYLEKLHREKGVPVLTLSLDGIYDKSFKANLELLVHKAKLYKNMSS